MLIKTKVFFYHPPKKPACRDACHFGPLALLLEKGSTALMLKTPAIRKTGLCG
jgi:hypothetical protein